MMIDWGHFSTRNRRGDQTAYLVASVDHIEKEQLEVEVFSLTRMAVQLRERHEDVIIRTAIEEAQCDDGCDRPEGVPEEKVRVLEDTVETVRMKRN